MLILKMERYSRLKKANWENSTFDFSTPLRGNKLSLNAEYQTVLRQVIPETAFARLGLG